MKLRHGQAVALMVLVTFLWSTAGVVTRHLEQAQAFEITFWRSFFTLLSLMVILPLWQGWGVWQRMRQEGWVLWASGACWAVMFTGFMVALASAGIAWMFVRQLDGTAWMGMLVALLEVLFGIALVWWLVSEVPSAAVLQGGVLVLGALVLNEWLGWREREGHYRIQQLAGEQETLK